MGASARLIIIGFGVFLLALVFVYIAARLAGLGVARSWFEFKSKLKGGKR